VVRREFVRSLRALTLKALALFSASVLAACVSDRSSQDPWPSEAASSDAAIGWMDGEPVTYGELSLFLRARDALVFSRTLDALLVERVTRAESDRFKVDVAVALVERRTRGRYQAFETRLRLSTKEQTGEEADPAAWLNRTLGLTPEEFRIFIRAQIKVELLQDRLIRYSQFREQTVEVSTIVVLTDEDAAMIERALAAGKLFAVLAKQHSKHSTAPRGGLIDHRMLRTDFDSESTSRAVFASAVGKVVGPLVQEAEGRKFHQFFLVGSKHICADKPYPELSRMVEADLEKRPVSMGEYVHWRRRMQDQHGFLPAARSSANDSP
jgi:hypothetical protein